MIIVVCIDKTGGMVFNNHRQSQDLRLRERILNIANGKSLIFIHHSIK